MTTFVFTGANSHNDRRSATPLAPNAGLATVIDMLATGHVI